jgi:O-antigen/teichoic acid export membrane protein
MSSGKRSLVHIAWSVWQGDTWLSSGSEHNLAGRTAAGASLLIALRLITRCIDLVTLCILGRLLSPGDFGLVAIAMTLILIVEAILELPLNQALTRLPALRKAHYDTAFTLGLMRGLGLALILLIAAWPFARLYDDYRLTALIAALAIAPAARGLSSPRLAEFAKKLDFRRDFAMEIAGKSVAFMISVSIALLTSSYWSLAIGTIVTPLTMVAVSYVLAPYRPALSLKEWHTFAGFLGWSSASQAIFALNWQMDQLFLGRFASRVELGNFSMATNLAFMPMQILIVQIIRPIMSAFSLISHDAGRLGAAYQVASISTLTFGIPIMVGMSILAEPLTRLILGDQWIEAAPALCWLSLSIIPAMFVTPLAPLSMALNRTRILLHLASIEFLLKLPLTFVGAAYYGIAGVLVARVGIALVIAGGSMLAVRELIALSIRDQVLGPWRPILSCIIMAAFIVPLESRFRGLPVNLSMVAGLIATIFLGAVVYSASMFLLWWIAGRPRDCLESKVTDFIGFDQQRNKEKIGR